MKFLNQGFDHVEFAVSDLAYHGALWERLGFERIGSRKLGRAGTESTLFAQGEVRILLTQAIGDNPASKDDSSIRFLNRHGDGICVLAIEVEDARKAFDETTSRGAKPASEPKYFNSEHGSVIRAEIYSPSDLRFAFIERKSSSPKNPALSPALFDEALVVDRLKSPSPFGIQRIDHLTNNVDIGEMREWVEWYKRVFGFSVTRHFDIRTGRTGLISDVVESEDRKIKVPINEATEPESQVQEFVDRFNGPGVQHLALQTTEIIQTVGAMRSKNFKFLEIPHTYYEKVPSRVPGVKEDLSMLEDLQVLLDGEASGYLLQIFTAELVGPFFLEIIQRKGNEGFGEGNFRALFEAIERDQVHRGVLK